MTPFHFISGKKDANRTALFSIALLLCGFGLWLISDITTSFVVPIFQFLSLSTFTTAGFLFIRYNLTEFQTEVYHDGENFLFSVTQKRGRRLCTLATFPARTVSRTLSKKECKALYPKMQKLSYHSALFSEKVVLLLENEDARIGVILEKNADFLTLWEEHKHLWATDATTDAPIDLGIDESAPPTEKEV